jgi:cytochrome c oxidase subunit 4
VEHSAALTATPGYADDVDEIHVDHHPGPGQYVTVAIVLGVVTAIEVAVYYVDMPGKALVAILVGLASIKFSLVVAYFMHLKFDSRLLRRVFLTGVVLTLFVFSAGLFTMDLLFH